MKSIIVISLIFLSICVFSQTENNEKKYSIGLYSSIEYPLITNKTTNFKKGGSISYSFGIQQTLNLDKNISVSLNIGYSDFTFNKKYYGSTEQWNIKYIEIYYNAITMGFDVSFLTLMKGNIGFGCEINYVFKKTNYATGDYIPYHYIDLFSQIDQTQFIYVPRIFWEKKVLDFNWSELYLEASLDYFMNNPFFNYILDEDTNPSKGNGLTLKTKLIWYLIN